MIVAPGSTATLVLSVLVAVRPAANGLRGGGEAIVRVIGPPAGVAVAFTRAPDGDEYGVEDADDEFGDTESAEAISIIKLVRQRMNATE
jgi:hypothetical protein